MTLFAQWLTLTVRKQTSKAATHRQGSDGAAA
jgi:hypothetical protein